MRDIIPHGFINSILLLLLKKTCSIQEFVMPVAMRANFTELHQCLLLQEDLG